MKQVNRKETYNRHLRVLKQPYREWEVDVYEVAIRFAVKLAIIQ